MVGDLLFNRPVDKIDAALAAHTITQRLRNLKRIPPELIPLGVVIAYV